MRFSTAGFAVVVAAILAAPSVALAAAAAPPAGPPGGALAPPPAPPAVALAPAKLASVNDAPRYFKVVSVTLPAGKKSSVTGPAGVIYQVIGSSTVTLGGESK